MRYWKFFQEFKKRKSSPVQLLVNFMPMDLRTAAGRNLHFIETETGIDPLRTGAQKVCESLPRELLPDQDVWRLPLLNNY